MCIQMYTKILKRRNRGRAKGYKSGLPKGRDRRTHTIGDGGTDPTQYHSFPNRA